MLIKDIFGLVSFPTNGTNKLKSLRSMVSRHMQLQILRHYHFATQITHYSWMRMFDMRVHGLLRTPHVVTIFRGTIDTVHRSGDL